MSSVLIQRVIEVYDNDEQAQGAYLAQFAVSHEKLLPDMNRISIKNITAAIIDSAAIFNTQAKTFSYNYVLDQEVIKSTAEIFVEERFRFSLMNRYEGWTVTFIPDYEEFIEEGLPLDESLLWDGHSITRAI